MEIRFGDVDEVLHIIERGDELVNYFTSEGTVSRCPLIENNLKDSVFIAEGKQGEVSTFSFGISGDTNEYVVKKTLNREYTIERVGLEDFEHYSSSDDTMTLNQIGKRMNVDFFGGMSLSMFFAINGGDASTRVNVLEDTVKILTKKRDSGKCLTKKSFGVDKWWADRFTVVPREGDPSKVDHIPHKVETREMFLYPEGSYMCGTETYTEYVIGLMCAKLKTSGKCANFIEVFGFSMCADSDVEKTEVYDYTFMERVRGSVAKGYTSLRAESNTPEFAEDLVDSIVIQTYFALSCMQRILGIQHNDLHNDNVMFQDLDQSESVMFNGEDLTKAKWFSYTIDEVSVYFKNCGPLIKIADFGFAMKYSEPFVGQRSIANGRYAQIPAWRDDYYDLMFSLGDMFGTFGALSPMLYRLYALVFDPYDTVTSYSDARRIQMSLLQLYFQGLGRPSFTGVQRHPWEYLTDPYVMGKHLTPPPRGEKVISLGTLSPTDFHPKFYNGDHLPSRLYSESEIRRYLPQFQGPIKPPKPELKSKSTSWSRGTNSRSRSTATKMRELVYGDVKNTLDSAYESVLDARRMGDSKMIGLIVLTIADFVTKKGDWDAYFAPNTPQAQDLLKRAEKIASIGMMDVVMGDDSVIRMFTGDEINKMLSFASQVNNHIETQSYPHKSKSKSSKSTSNYEIEEILDESKDDLLFAIRLGDMRSIARIIDEIREYVLHNDVWPHIVKSPHLLNKVENLIDLTLANVDVTSTWAVKNISKEWVEDIIAFIDTINMQLSIHGISKIKIGKEKNDFTKIAKAYAEAMEYAFHDLDVEEYAGSAHDAILKIFSTPGMDEWLLTKKATKVRDRLITAFKYSEMWNDYIDVAPSSQRKAIRDMIHHLNSHPNS